MIAENLRVSSCDRCLASVIWTITESGERMSVDAEPVDDGNILLKIGRGVPAAKVVSNPSLFDEQSSAPRYVSHVVVCPKARRR